jgi:hypothetical protein
LIEISAPEAVIQRQLDAYNAHDLEGWLATYAGDARQFDFPAMLLAEGIQAIRERAIERFQDSRLHAELVHRSVVGNIVIDHEVVTRTFPEGPVTIDLVVIYQVIDGKIKTASFAEGPPALIATRQARMNE